jgi:hypothetical protein
VKVKKIDDHLSVADQITKKDISAITKAGFKSIVCNRPDGEVPGQPTFKEIEQAAIKANLPIGRVTKACFGILPLWHALHYIVGAFQCSNYGQGLNCSDSG